MKTRITLFVATVVVSLYVGMSALPTKADAPDIFRARGQSAFAALGVANINGCDYRINLNVIRDVASGDTTLFIQAFTPLPPIPPTPGNPNVTRRTLRGPIPSSDLIIAPDLTSATLNTTIGTDLANHFFDNAEVGFIVSLSINLTWTSHTLGNLVDTFVFNGRTIGDPGFAFRETFHQNGPHAEGFVAGMFGATPLSDKFGSLDANRSFDMIQPR